jgi:hypothetical protein
MTDQDMTPRRAALIVVIGLVATTFGVPIAEFVIWPSLVDPESIQQTVRNIRANEGAFLFASFAYLVGFVGDVLVAWALYFLLRPVSRSLAALTAAFRAVQAVIAIGAALSTCSRPSASSSRSRWRPWGPISCTPRCWCS